MHQIQLANGAFEGQNSVYLLGADDAGVPTTLVDAGVNRPEVEAELRDALDAQGVSFADVDQVLLTHWHLDHAGLAGTIQDEGGATIYAHEADAPLAAQDEDAVAAVEAAQRDAIADWGTPEDKQRELFDFRELHEKIRGRPADVTPVQDGDVISLGEFDVEVVHLPGHAAGLVAYVFERDGRREAFVGDAVLPKYTPNVGGADVRVDRPLAQYLDSLQRVRDLDLDRAWPGHRGAIFAPSERAADIADHHEERTERVLAVVDESGPVTPWEVSAALFGSLSNIHILHGPGEAYAHLDHLVDEGVLGRTDDGYVRA